MTFYKGNHTEPVGGSARQARADLKDRRAGAYDRVTPKPAHPMREQRTTRHKAQSGSGVQPEIDPTDAAVPDGLRRDPTHPINPSTGRGGPAAHVPEHAPGRKR